MILAEFVRTRLNLPLMFFETVREVEKFGGRQGYNTFYRNAPRQDWCRMNLSHNRNDVWDYSLNLVFYTTYWWLWKWRNYQIFKEEERIPFDKCNTIKSYVDECKLVWSPSILTKIPRFSVLSVCQQKPTEGHIKITMMELRIRSRVTLQLGDWFAIVTASGRLDLPITLEQGTHSLEKLGRPCMGSRLQWKEVILTLSFNPTLSNLSDC